MIAASSPKSTRRLRTQEGEIIDLCEFSPGYRMKILEEIERGERKADEAAPFKMPFVPNVAKITFSKSTADIAAPITMLSFSSTDEDMLPAWIEGRCVRLAKARMSRLSSGPMYDVCERVNSEAGTMSDHSLAKNDEVGGKIKAKI